MRNGATTSSAWLARFTAGASAADIPSLRAAGSFFQPAQQKRYGHWLSWAMDEEEYRRTEDCWFCPEGDAPAISVSALLRAHSTFHREVVPLLYSQKTFRPQDVEDFVDWGAKIGPSNAALVRSLRIRYTTPAALDYHRQTFEALAHLSGIRSLAFGKLGPRFFLGPGSIQGQRYWWHPRLLSFA